ncbi:adenylate kinase isoenzyme 6 [Nasonia vitripennis]|uniref:Adenylate kinase isoenzyme 6 homolog n=1 Tax=Nasonia vitripennis TaxID=7425 RepID=A0A7M7G5E1_NASVI|nr:adenylate kinase isoenzyme 6 [Nasonia vitripennis]XP_031782402.1 adenylate kinase isoenzyme 6 [Nasonia vitripennis]XP_032453933.1 adenylate kinase isoenzyme 6 [Nasonia vitripennis]
MSNSSRKLPNILVTGTPGVGKSELSRLLAERTGFGWLDVSKLAIEHKCLESFDEEYQCPVLDEDKLLDLMEPMMAEGGKIVDYHGTDFFPERWFDIVFVLRTNNTILYDRLVARGYSGKKLEDNIDCEIFQTLLIEAKESYKEEIVHELQSNIPEQTIDNVNRICQWIEQWKLDNQ